MSTTEIITMCAVNNLEEGRYPIPRNNIEKQIAVDIHRRFIHVGFFARLVGFGKSREMTIRRYEKELDAQVSGDEQ